jgi:hypothetical protein
MTIVFEGDRVLCLGFRNQHAAIPTFESHEFPEGVRQSRRHHRRGSKLEGAGVRLGRLRRATYETQSGKKYGRESFHQFSLWGMR